MCRACCEQGAGKCMWSTCSHTASILHMQPLRKQRVETFESPEWPDGRQWTIIGSSAATKRESGLVQDDHARIIPFIRPHFPWLYCSVPSCGTQSVRCILFVSRDNNSCCCISCCRSDGDSPHNSSINQAARCSATLQQSSKCAGPQHYLNAVPAAGCVSNSEIL